MRDYRFYIGLGIAAALALSVQLGSAQDAAKPAAAKAHSYIGTKACGMCHKGAAKGSILETWQATAHAKSMDKVPADQKSNATCLGCHATGFGKPGGYDPAAATKAAADHLAAVGCEACHGPGNDYKSIAVMKDPVKAKAAGLLEVTEATCKGCHAGTVPAGHKPLPKFDFATEKPKIAHSVTKK